ncbi:MAG: Hpt domain-containing protein [Chitinophagales bacterium]
MNRCRMEMLGDKFNINEILPLNPDISALEKLSAGDTAFVNEIITVFVAETPALLFEMDLALQNDNFKLLAALLHKYKSSVSLVGKKQLYLLAGNLELKIIQLKVSNDAESLQQDLNQLILISLGIIKYLKFRMLKLNNIY